MNIEFVRTFLTAVAAGNFVLAAERLHITQSTVSTRIKALEQSLGVALFHRYRYGVELTAAGQRFLKHAKHLIKTFDQARHDVGLPSGYSGSITLRARIALWEDCLPEWTSWFRQHRDDISLRMEIGFEEDIMQGLVQGSVDIGVMYTPQSRKGLGIEHIFDEKLLLVSTNEEFDWHDGSYIHIDWGAEFEMQFSTHFTDIPPPALLANVGWLGVRQMLHSGGAGYFPYRMTHHLISSGRLHKVDDSPVISLPVYLAYPLDRTDSTMTTALNGLRLLGNKERENNATCPYG
ncbi:MAG: LysR family transcriptional regulator [Motiliproteus sp.]|nr:LysR family transcriptional regulator [Motiliproteus sp.]